MPGHSSNISFEAVPFGPVQATVMGLAFLCALVDGLDLQLIAYVAPVVARELELSDMAMGLVFSAGFIGLAIGSMFLASLGDRWGRKTVLVSSLILFGGCVLITPIAQNVVELAILRLATGLGLGGVMPNAIAISIEYAPRRYRAFMVTFTYMGFMVGAAAGGAFAAFLLRRFGWEFVFVSAGVVPLILAVVITFWMPESLEYLSLKDGVSRRTIRIMRRLKIEDMVVSAAPRKSEIVEKSRMKALFSEGRWKNTLFIWIAMFTNLLSLFSLLQWLPTILEREGMPLEEANLLVSFMWLIGILGALFFAYLSRRASPQRVMAVYLVLSVFFTAALGAAAGENVVLAWPLIIGIGLTGASAQIGFYSLLSELYPASIRVTGIGVAQGIGRVAAIGGPAIVGVVLTAGLSHTEIFLWLAAPLLISAAAVWNVKKAPSSASELNVYEG